MVFVSLVVIAWYLGTLYTIARAKRGSPTRLTESLSHDISHMFSRRKTAAAKTGGAEDGLAGGLVDVAILDQDRVRIPGLNAGHHHALDQELGGFEEEIVHMDASVGHHVLSEQEQQHSGRQAGEQVDQLTAGGTGEDQPGETAWKHPLRGPDEGLTCEGWLEHADGMSGGRDFNKQPIRVRDGQVSTLSSSRRRWDILQSLSG